MGLPQISPRPARWEPPVYSLGFRIRPTVPSGPCSFPVGVQSVRLCLPARIPEATPLYVLHWYAEECQPQIKGVDKAPSPSTNVDNLGKFGVGSGPSQLGWTAILPPLTQGVESGALSARPSGCFRRKSRSYRCLSIPDPSGLTFKRLLAWSFGMDDQQKPFGYLLRPPGSVFGLPLEILGEPGDKFRLWALSARRFQVFGLPLHPSTGLGICPR